MTIDLGNVITAMVTPFKNNKKLAIDYDKATLLANHLLNNGTDTVLLTGSTGEDTQLSLEEKWNFVQTIRQNIPSKKHIIVSTGDTNTNRAIAKAKRAFDLGSDAVLVNVPEYIKPSPNAMYIHFNAIAEAVYPNPVIIYNIPGRTGSEIPPDTVASLAYSNSNIIGIKQSYGNLDRVSQMMADPRMAYRPDFQIYSGDDSLTLPMLALGAKGVISVASHLNGNLIQKMIQEFKLGHIDEARQIHLGLLPLFQVLFMETNPTPIKEALFQKGMIETPECRTLGTVSSACKNELNRVLKIFDNPQNLGLNPLKKTQKSNLLQQKIQRAHNKQY